MIDPKSHSENRGWIESILRFIPGFRGYLEREYRRESDYLARKWMADRLQQSKRGLDDYMLGLVNAGQLDPLTSCERLKTRLDGLINNLRGAVRGYSGFFDFVQVDTDVLDGVYELDMALCQGVEALADGLEKLPQKPDPTGQAALEFLRQVDEVSSQFQERADMLAGMKP